MVHGLILEFIGEEFWTGLINPMGVTCSTRFTCNDELNWASDGAPANGFVAIVRHNGMLINDKQLCVRFSDNRHINDDHCHEEKYFACEYACRQGVSYCIAYVLSSYLFPV